VRTLSPNDLRATGATLVLANTTTLHVRPASRSSEKLGALHRFMGWIVRSSQTSGGFQVFSLEGRAAWTRTVWSSRVTWTAGRRTLTPERATEIQWTLGADIVDGLRSRGARGSG